MTEPASPPDLTPAEASKPGLIGWLRGVGGPPRYLLILGWDVVAITASLFLAYYIRFDGHIPESRVSQFADCLPLLLVIRLALHLGFGLHRWSFRLSGLHEGLRIIYATLVGSALFASSFYFFQRAAEDVSLGPPRAVIVIEFLLTTSLIGAARFSFRVILKWGTTALRPRSGTWVRTIIVGAGSAGDLLLRDLQRSDEHNYRVIGFVDDEPLKQGATIGGQLVLGTLNDLPDVVKRWKVEQLLFAVPRLSAERLRMILDSCADLKLSYKTLPVSFAYLNDRIGVSMMEDLAPEHLLPRTPIQFDQEETRTRVIGRRFLVTGASGSIGSEISRQLASLAPSRLVLADINENGLYFLVRHLQRAHPTLDVVPEVVDIRDAGRVIQLGLEHRPQVVLHAAAHKHVPLMERNPEEAVKNNVIGCRNVVDMADTVGAERFVLISTDKAVSPSSVMGATKRIAEMLVRGKATNSSTSFAVVRFGNVLGSAGSVVPLFKSQIARGGPVTITHPDCRRFLMTIREAVGLTLLAGLGPEGDLLVLQMGEQIRILDIAHVMISLAGYVPEREISIIYTGLRPGEKLTESLMSEDEERHSTTLRDGIVKVKSVSPPRDLDERVFELAALAAEGNRAGIVACLGRLIPDYTPLGDSSSTVGRDETGNSPEADVTPLSAEG
jgi:FlaA1/EpsC-like NDP-sugar epimerase